jgi:DNA (cytosine-5)-methyltransferase 1
MAGMLGSQSSLVRHVFRLLEQNKYKPRFLIFENVAFALHLHGGQAIRQVVSELERLKYHWAYRILDSREFGLPQRRRRIFIVADREANPLPILYDGINAGGADHESNFFGFYWTEGNRGIGWAPEAIPPLKGGSGLSIPAPPAVWGRDEKTFFSPGLSDAERLQGFPRGWTSLSAQKTFEDRVRWRLIGNAVSVPVAHWVGRRLVQHNAENLAQVELPKTCQSKRHNMGWGGPSISSRFADLPTEGPSNPKRTFISGFKFGDAKSLSLRAAAGFLGRLLESPLRADPDFVRALQAYCSELRSNKAA